MSEQTKICTKCSLEKPFSEFRASTLGKNGLRSNCISCGRIYRKNHPEDPKTVQRRNKRHYQERKDNFKKANSEYYQARKNEIKEKARLNYLRNKDKIRERQKLYYLTNTGFSKHSEKRVKRNLLKSKATIDKTLIPQMEDFYERSSKDQHVDHILPLHNDLICGLNVPWNLQYLTKVENLKKGNSFDGTYDNEGWRSRGNECHQYVRRLQTESEDRELGMPFGLKASQFHLQNELLSEEVRLFIKRYEWLGTIGWNVKYCFTARYEGKLAGVVLMSEPVAPSIFTKKAGRNIEALIQRGACSSWAPKNLNSRLVMYSCRWMLDNTDKRVFMGYSDPEANEYGTIYQACNFTYLGRSFGNSKLYTLPNGKKVGGRYFTRTSSMKKWARILGIIWQPVWCKSNGYQDVSRIPREILGSLRRFAEEVKSRCPQESVESKGKYVLILTRKVEKDLREMLEGLVEARPYPKRPSS